MPKLSGL
jgi:hypothetical protein